MSELSPRRRLTGRAAIAAAFLAVPLTASICYAEGAPSVLVASAQAAEAEPAVEEWTEADVRQEQEELAEARIEIDREFDEAEREMVEAEREFAEAERELAEIERDLAADNKSLKLRRVNYNGKEWDELSEAERAELRREMANIRRELAEGGKHREEMRELRRQFAENGKMRREVRLAVAQAEAESARASAMAPEVVVACKDEYTPVVTETDAKGKTTLFVCETAGEKLALRAMKQARSAIAAEQSLSATERAEALRELDREIAELQSKR